MSDRDLRTTTAGQRGPRITIHVDGRAVDACEGESVAAALLAAGLRTFRITDRDQAPRSYYCGMGVCHDCLVTIDGEPNVRACMSRVRPGIRVERQPSLGIGAHR
ncbi:MAG: (2Fe-2S)-binding protein [Candidatus Rokubacteria bacterium]|nr:(2Fe-2S)-binding protein [Candidatus Rokubacteria bacterium]